MFCSCPSTHSGNLTIPKFHENNLKELIFLKGIFCEISSIVTQTPTTTTTTRTLSE